jgi:hypothetical protein
MKKIILIGLGICLLFIVGCSKYNPYIHTCLESECKPICNTYSSICNLEPPDYCNMDIVDDESNCQVGFCDSCIRWK